MVRRTPRRSFTLVEMLVVITIIGMLATLLTAAVMGALARAQEAKVKVELDNIAAGFQAYKAKYGSYPPNLSDTTAVEAHLRKLFPRANPATEVAAIPAGGNSEEKAIVFWLGGFDPNPRTPISGSGTRTPFFDFDKSRILRDASDNPMAYQPPGLAQAYVYYNSLGLTPTVKGPYADADSNVIGPFQVNSAGLDDDWGSGAVPNFGDSTATIPDGFADNLMSFSDRNFEDSVP